MGVDADALRSVFARDALALLEHERHDAAAGGGGADGAAMDLSLIHI